MSGEITRDRRRFLRNAVVTIAAAELGYRTARAWVVLMKRLGYARFVAQGGDLGAGVCTVMAKQGRRGFESCTAHQ